MTTNQYFEKMMRRLIKRLGKPDDEDLPTIREVFDTGVEAGRAEILLEQSESNKIITEKK